MSKDFDDQNQQPNHPNPLGYSEADSLGLSSNMSSTVSIESPPTEQRSIVIDRPIFHTKDFYPLNPAQPKFDEVKDGETKVDSSENLFSAPSKFGRFTEKIKSVLPRHHHHHTHRKPFSARSVLYSFFPITKWISQYSIRENLASDILAGVTLFAMHVPNGLSGGQLAGVQPMSGIYVSLFPVLIYAIFGGSRQISIGTFMVISIACRDVIEQVNGGDFVDALNRYEVDEEATIQPQEPPLEILTSLCLLVGLIQFVVGLMRLGVFATLLSDPIISAFNVGAAVHVFTSQVFALFDIDSSAGTAEEKIPFEIIRSYYRLFSRITTANVSTTIMSLIIVIILVGCKSFVEPYLMRRFHLKKLIIPIDIIMIIGITLISYLADFHGVYGVKLIPKINAGFDVMPIMPRVDLWPKIFPSAILISFLCYTSAYSMEKSYAHKNHYDVEPNQELFAMGLANIGSSFFLCFPAAASLARTALSDKIGGKTQVVSLISSGMIVIFVLFFSQYLETLPNCSLACILDVALISTFMKFTDVFDYWKVSIYDGLLWIITLLLVVFVGVDFGLLISIGIGIALMVWHLALPPVNIKVNIPESECYLEEKAANGLQIENLSSGILIYEFHSPLLFVNVERFMHGIKDKFMDYRESALASTPIHTFIFDMSRVSYVDGKAVECLVELEPSLALPKYSGFSTPNMQRRQSQVDKQQPIRLLLACISKPVLKTLNLCHFFTKFEYEHCFLTTHDAVAYALKY